MSPAELIEAVTERFPAAVSASHTYRGDATVVVRREAVLEVAGFLREDPALRMNFLMDLTAVDYSAFGKRPTPAFFASSGVAVRPSVRLADDGAWPGPPEQSRFAVVYHFYSTPHKHRLRLVVLVEESAAEVDSLTRLWPGADWLEREVWDMFGIVFRSHPNLKRILMYEGFEGHPLRKDYPVNKRQPLIGPGARQPSAGVETAPAPATTPLPRGDPAELETRDMMLNVGPAHPAMHGIIRIVAKLDGERVRDAEVEIGYLHRGFEKMAEVVDFNGVIPYTDRLNYVSPLINNMGYCMAVEKLLGVSVPERCHYIRVILSEISRITDHLTCVGASAMELGAFTVFLYMIKAREYLWELVESATGARLTVSYGRVGGVKADLPEGFAPACHSAFAATRKVLAEANGLLTRNRIFMDRMNGTGVIGAAEAISYGITGPFLRATGADYDVRKDCPYAVYDRLPFDVPVGSRGDNMDRYLVRMEEMEQSMRIVEAALRDMPTGPVQADVEAGRPMPAAGMVDLAKVGDIAAISGRSAAPDPTLEGSGRDRYPSIATGERRVFLPPKEDTYGNIEGLMQHFKLVMYGHGVRPPHGEVYFPVEGGNGELGFYVVSDGAACAYRVRVRPPCFAIMSALPKLLIGDMVADIIPTFGSVNMIGGELDR
jgi:NADH:ubiquinone oxidoreductase subunit D/NADH:ubiquinone oxidoreductase subunit C